MNVGAPLDACGPRTRVVCDWVYERTDGNATLAALADWLVGRPLAIGAVLLGAWVLRWLARRIVTRAVARLLSAQPLILRTSSPADGGPPTGVPTREEARRGERAHAVATAVSSFLAALVWVVALITIAGILGLDLGPLIASAGLAGLALAFGAQSLIKDMLAGLFILLEDHFAIGDEIEIGGATGTVEKITLRETVLRDLDGTVWHVRNGEIDRVGNHSQVWSAAMIDIDVARSTDLARARTVLNAVAAQVCNSPPFDREVLEPPEVLGVEALTADGVVLRLRVKTLAGRQFALQRVLLERIARAFDGNGLALATRQLIVRTPGVGSPPATAPAERASPPPTA